MPEFVDGWGKPDSSSCARHRGLSELTSIARGSVQSANGIGTSATATINAIGSRLSTAQGAYVGGTLVKMTATDATL